MRHIYLVLIWALVIPIFSCHKETTPLSQPPALTTVAVSNITDSTATSGGAFGSDGTETINIKGIQWDTTTRFQRSPSVLAGTGISNFSASLTGLTPATIYYVRAFAGPDSAHLQYGNTIQFTTTYISGKYLVTTVAGTGAAGFTNGDTAIATFYFPCGVAVDPMGNIYVADLWNNAVRKITPSGIVSSVLGQCLELSDVVSDTAGNIYAASQGYNQIFKVSPADQVSVFAGSGSKGNADGTGMGATFNGPITLAIDPAGNLYVGDGSAFRKITPAAVVTTLPNYFVNSNSTGAIAIGVDNHFNLYESNGTTIIKVDSNGNETFLAGSGKQGNADGTGQSASFGSIEELRTDATGNIYAADRDDNKIRMITPSGVVTTIAGTGAAGARDGNSAVATFRSPTGLAIDNSGNIIVADAGNNKIRKISPQ